MFSSYQMLTLKQAWLDFITCWHRVERTPFNTTFLRGKSPETFINFGKNIALEIQLNSISTVASERYDIPPMIHC